jgi:DNA ligase 4
MAAIDCEFRYNSNIIFEEFDEIFDQIIIISSFSFIDLRERIKEKYGRRIRVNELFSRIFRILNSSEAKWMVRILLKNYSPVYILEISAMLQFHFLLSDFLRFQSSLEIAVK